MSAPSRLPGLRRASGSSRRAGGFDISVFLNAGRVQSPAQVQPPAGGSPPTACAPPSWAGDESINRLSNFDTSPSDNSISPFSPQAVLVVIRVIIKQ